MLLIAVSLLLADPPITAGNWRAHPAIVAISAQVDAIETRLKGVKPREKHFPDCLGSDGDMDRYAFADATGTRKLHLEGGSGDDSGWRMDAYYNDNGALLFVIIRATAVNHAELEHRIYFAGTKRLYENHVFTTDVTYPFFDPWPSDEIPFSAAERWVRQKACEKED